MIEPRRRHRRRAPRRRVIVAILGLGLIALVAAVGFQVAFRYLPALDDARALRADLDGMVERARTAGLGLERDDLRGLETDLERAAGRLQRLDALLADDPGVAIARVLPPTRDPVAGADAIAAAGNELLAAADATMTLADRYVSIKEAQAVVEGSGASSLAQLVELMATGEDDVDNVLAALDRAQALLDGAPADLPNPLGTIRDTISDRLAEYEPALQGYAAIDATLPDILGWAEPRRYLVLTQNPAELRPSGGYIGSFGTVTFDKGRVTERAFQDVFLLDLPWDFPFIAAPPELRDYLLGPKQPWQLADANWSPDFPTSAQEAIRLYRNEDGPGDLQGVIAITTQTIDELLRVTGPVTVPEYDVTIAAGETTLKVLQNTRVAANPDQNRKAFLSSFADQLFDSLFALSPGRWVDLVTQGDTLQSGRLLQAWFEDPAAQAQMATLGFDGSVRQDRGDYVYPVDSNVSPVSKLNAVTDRELALSVQLDAYGNADNELAARWTNRIESDEAKPYRELPFVGDLRTLGMYFRMLVPDRSRLEEVEAGTRFAVTAPTSMGTEAGRMVIANYFRIPPGTASLRYRWTSPYPAEQGDDGIYTYRLTVQKQPGLRPGPISLRIALPPGALNIESSAGLTRIGEALTVETTFDRDIVAVVRYRLPVEAP